MTKLRNVALSKCGASSLTHCSHPPVPPLKLVAVTSPLCYATTDNSVEAGPPPLHDRSSGSRSSAFVTSHSALLAVSRSPGAVPSVIRLSFASMSAAQRAAPTASRQYRYSGGSTTHERAYQYL